MAGKRYSAQDRVLLLKRLADGQQRVSDFARENGISVATLYNWQQQAMRQEDAGFIEIKAPDAREKEIPMVLQAGDVVLRFEQLPDAGWLATLVDKLSR
jgi:transposase-like protein